MDMDKEHLDSTRFRPMSEGLGLNHFADGLPYTPTNSRRKTSVSFNFPPPRAPRMQESKPEARSVPSPVTPMALEQELELEASNANFIRRILAFAVDVAVSSSIFVFIVWASFAINGFDIAQLLAERRGVQMFWPLTLLYFVLQAGYFLVQEMTWRRTLGKALFGIRIRAKSGFATLGRAVCFLVAAIPLGIGLLWYFFDPKRRCWHDVITDSEVVINS